MNVDYLLRMRKRFADWLREIAAVHPPKSEVDLDALADTSDDDRRGRDHPVESACRPGLMGRQTRLFRNHIKLLFGA